MHRCTDRLLRVLVEFLEGNTFGNIFAVFVLAKGTLFIHLTNFDKTRFGYCRILIGSSGLAEGYTLPSHYPGARPGPRRMICH
jgi:hypothetical protein